MLQGVGTGHSGIFLVAHAVEGAAGAGQDQSFDLSPVGTALKTLKNRRVLTVHRDDLRSGQLRSIHHQLTGAHQCLLVGKGDALFLADGRKSGLQAHHAHNGCYHRVCLREGCRLGKGLKATQNTGGRIRKADGKIPCRRLVGHDRQSGFEFSCLGFRALHAGMGGDGCNAQAHLLCHFQSLTTDGTGGAQY